MKGMSRRELQATTVTRGHRFVGESWWKVYKDMMQLMVKLDLVSKEYDIECAAVFLVEPDFRAVGSDESEVACR